MSGGTKPVVKCLMAALAIGLALCAMAAHGAPTGWEITQITDNSYHENWPLVSGPNVVWSGGDSHRGEIFLYDGSTTTQIADNGDSFTPMSVRVSGSNAVWTARLGSDFTRDIFLYDGSATTQITDNRYYDRSPAVSGSNVVWEGAWNLDPSDPTTDPEIFLYDGSTTTQITDDRYSGRNPAVSGSNVVWDDGNEMFLYNGSTIEQITNNGPSGPYPQVSGSNVAWAAPGNLDPSDPTRDLEIFLYDGSTITQITNNSYLDQRPRVSGSNVVWHSGNAIFLYDGSITKQLANNLVGGVPPQISGSNVVWNGWSAQASEIFLYDGSATTQITDNGRGSYNPQISGSNIVFQGGWNLDPSDRTTDQEIFLATPVGPPPPDPEPPPGSRYDLPVMEGQEHRVSSGLEYRAQQGIATDGTTWFTSRGSFEFWVVPPTLSKFHSDWTFDEDHDLEQPVPGVPAYHVGDIAYSGLHDRIYAPVKYREGLRQVQTIAGFKASDLSRVTIWDPGVDAEIGGLAIHDAKLYGIEYLGLLSLRSDANLFAWPEGNPSQRLNTLTLEDTKYANGIAFWDGHDGNDGYDYFYVSAGGLSRRSWKHGKIHVFKVEDMNGDPSRLELVETLTYPVPDFLPWYHAEGLTFKAGQLWVSEWNHVARLNTYYLPKYKSESTADGGNWSQASSWDTIPDPTRTAHVERGIVHIDGNAEALGLIIDGGGAVVLDSTGSLTLRDILAVHDGSFTADGGSLQFRRLEVGVHGDGAFAITDWRSVPSVLRSLLFGRRGAFNAVPGSVIRMMGSDFMIESTDPSAYADLMNLTLIFEGGGDVIDIFEVAGKDLGATTDGETLNFGLGTLQIGGEDDIGAVELVSWTANQAGSAGAEALYVNNLVVNPGSTFYLNTFNVYVDGVLVRAGDGDLYGGGRITIPEPATLILLGVGGLGLLIRRRRKQ